MANWFSRRVIVSVLLVFICAPALVRAADGPRIAQAQASSITGTLRTPAGAAVPGATVTATGPARATATTDAAGAFTLAVLPGIYRLAVSKAGYVSASTSDIVVAAGSSVPLTVTIAEQNLTSLRTIGSVTSSGRSPTTFNTGAATQSYVSGDPFAQIANPQVNDVLSNAFPTSWCKSSERSKIRRLSSAVCNPTKRKCLSTGTRSRSGNTACG